MQGRPTDSAAGDEHRLQFRHGRQRAGAAHLHSDLLEHRLGLFGGVLVGDRPTGSLGGGTALLAQSHGVEFDHRAVGFVIEIMAHPVQFVDRRHQIVMRAAGPNPFRRREPKLIQPIQHLHLRSRHLAAHFAQTIQEHAQRPFGNDLWIEHFQ